MQNPHILSNPIWRQSNGTTLKQSYKWQSLRPSQISVKTNKQLSEGDQLPFFKLPFFFSMIADWHNLTVSIDMQPFRR